MVKYYNKFAGEKKMTVSVNQKDRCPRCGKGTLVTDFFFLL